MDDSNRTCISALKLLDVRRFLLSIFMREKPHSHSTLVADPVNMALNKLMHPRNIYKDRKPDFKGLAIKYPEFRRHAITDLQGKVHIDFKKPECLRAVTWALLKEDWGLEVDLPLDRLIPTVPLRLNYLLWLEDLLQGEKDVIGIDIGTGASCVYCLLGAKKNKWKFIGSEIDHYSYTYAIKNIEENNLQDSIKMVKVKQDSGLHDLVTSGGSSEVKYSFCMSNPPFFANNLEAWGALTSRSEDRPEPRGVDTSSPTESIAVGGEVEFVRNMIIDSSKLKDRVRIYTSMIGKKTSLFPLKEELLKHGISNFGVTEFCQGRTMRWGIGWTFDPNVKFPKQPSKLQKADKPKPPIVYKIPRQMSLQPEVEYSVPDLGSKVMTYLDELKMIYEPEKSTPEILTIQAVAIENTWANQRRKRRQKMKDAASPPIKLPCHQGSDSACAAPGSEDGSGVKSSEGKEMDTTAAADTKTEKSEKDKMSESDTLSTRQEMERLNMSVEDVDEYILKCKVAVKKSEVDVVLEMTWEDGNNIELLHQVLQYFKNRLK